ncbi:unnamed protein product [Brachionus calyciflorus]|uniref:Golgi SNAP receptor complex member 2 n=1 Tax=Brachionus calyciflorus TaxID=104777 RepID=A0A813NVB8_9BILA|nr:unnamed protein product [Brachionus calyciflorus]
MERLYREAKANLLNLNENLSQFEKAITQEECDRMKAEILKKFNEISSTCDQLDIYVTKEPPNRKYDTKIKIDQLKYDFSHYKNALNQIQYRKDQKFLEAKRREELLRSTTMNSSSNNSGHVQFSLDGYQNELRHNSRLSRANYEMDQMIDHGENVLKHVQTQNDLLKDVKRKILNVTNSLGLSNSLIGIIERRNTSDKYVLFGGMIFTCIVMFLAVKYLT